MFRWKDSLEDGLRCVGRNTVVVVVVVVVNKETGVFGES